MANFDEDKIKNKIEEIRFEFYKRYNRMFDDLQKEIINIVNETVEPASYEYDDGK